MSLLRTVLSSKLRSRTELSNFLLAGMPSSLRDWQDVAPNAVCCRVESFPGPFQFLAQLWLRRISRSLALIFTASLDA